MRQLGLCSAWLMVCAAACAASESGPKPDGGTAGASPGGATGTAGTMGVGGSSAAGTAGTTATGTAGATATGTAGTTGTGGGTGACTSDLASRVRITEIDVGATYAYNEVDNNGAEPGSDAAGDLADPGRRVAAGVPGQDATAWSTSSTLDASDQPTGSFGLRRLRRAGHLRRRDGRRRC